MDVDAAAAEAKRDAHRNVLTARFWWANIPVVTAAVVGWYLFEWAWVEKAMFLYLALVSIVALAATYESKAKALEAKAAGYENP